MIMFADNTVYEVLRSQESCKRVAPSIETCDAKIITPPGNLKSIAAFYRRTFYEGGVKQGYVGKGIRITYFYRAPRIIGSLGILHSHEKAATTAALTSIPISDISRVPEKTAD
jgi:hypothetical protein